MFGLIVDQDLAFHKFAVVITDELTFAAKIKAACLKAFLVDDALFEMLAHIPRPLATKIRRTQRLMIKI